MITATYYDILKVEPHAAPAGVRAAYRSLAQRWHPDKLPGSADAVRVMAMLNEAYAVLSDPQRRARYDREMAAARAASARRTAVEPVEQEASWPWWLLFAVIAFVMTAIATVAWKMAFPTVPALAAQAQVIKVAATAPVKPAKN